MTASPDNSRKALIRPVQYRDLHWLEGITTENNQIAQNSVSFQVKLEQAKRWFGVLKFLSWFPNSLQDHFRVYVAELPQASDPRLKRLKGFIHISPFNIGRSTWRVERVMVACEQGEPELWTNPQGVASQLLRHCLENVWEARTWVLEVDINEKNTLALYRQNGFQPLAQLTYWLLEPKLLQTLAQQYVELPNLLPVSNADAHLLYQLDCVSMPPL